MAAFFHHIIPLTPPPNEEQRREVKCLQTIPYETKCGHILTIALLGRSHTIDAIAVTIPASVPAAPRSACIEQIVNHMLSIMRFAYDDMVDLIRDGDGFLSVGYEDDSPIPNYPMQIRQYIHEDHVVDVLKIAQMFCITCKADRAAVLSLISEAQSPSLPIHYKILSLVRCLEILLPDPRQRDAWLERYQVEFTKLSLSERRFGKALHEIRTRCAHGTSRGGAGPLASPAFPEKTALIQLVHLLRQAIWDHIGDSYGFRYTLPEQAPFGLRDGYKPINDPT